MIYVCTFNLRPVSTGYIHISIYLYLFIYLSIYLYIYIYISIYLSIYLSIYIYICIQTFQCKDPRILSRAVGVSVGVSEFDNIYIIPEKL